MEDVPLRPEPAVGALLERRAAGDVAAERVLRVDDRMAAAPLLHGRPHRNHVEAVLAGEVGVGRAQFRVHLVLVHLPPGQAAVPGRVAPRLLHDDLRLGGELADLRDQVVAEGMVGLGPPAEVARLLDRHDVPPVHPQRLADVERLRLHRAPAAYAAPVPVGPERRIAVLQHVLPVAFERAAADVERREVELDAHRLRHLRQLLQAADREAVADHQHLHGGGLRTRLRALAPGEKGKGGHRRHANRQSGPVHCMLLSITPLRYIPSGKFSATG